MLTRVCIITNKYPNDIDKNVLVFVQQLVWAMADLGVSCSVICPIPINLNYRYAMFPKKIIEQTENGSTVEVFFPKYIGFGQSDIFGYNPSHLTTYNFTNAVSRIVKNMNEKPDAVYGHFITPAGITAARIGRKFNIPSFMAYGEATIKTIEHFGFKQVNNELSNLDGVVAVSNQNKEMLVSTNAVKEEKIKVFSNGYRKERFFPRDKNEARKMYGFPKDEFIVCFVGSFDYRKGIERLMEAIKDIDGVYAICAGKGELMPSSNKCIYNKSVNNADLPFFYSAADVFVLPTLNEGCCNAIIEAMACGLPIISSNMPFNDDILDDTCSIRVDPLSITAIKNAISILHSDRGKLNELSKGSVEKARSLTLEIRAKNIINFINEVVVKHNDLTKEY